MATVDPALSTNLHQDAAREVLDTAALSLLSLSSSASTAAPIPVPSKSQQDLPENSVVFGNGSVGSVNSSLLGANGAAVGNGSMKHHRRLSSTGKTRRRLSDARDAATRPSPALLSLSGLSISSSSPPPNGIVPVSTSFTASSQAMGIPIPSSYQHPLDPFLSVSASSSVPLTNGLPASADDYNPVLPDTTTAVKPVSIPKNGKKRGMDHKCETCSKVYRHPSCLIKHRWEHTPHWKESSKFVLSKHQQVQLLEAAAILSHLSPDSSTGTSLPEDRSLWPSFLCGGTLPGPEGSPSYPAPNVISSSVPMPTTMKRATSTGPRLHDYQIDAADVTKVRPGLVVANGRSGSASPIPVPQVNGLGFGYGRSRSFQSQSITHSHSHRHSISSSSYGTGTSISLPRSSLRSGSVMSSRSESRSRSGSSELEEEEEEDEDEDIMVDDMKPYPYEVDIVGGKAGNTKREEEDWEMDMEMD